MTSTAVGLADTHCHLDQSGGIRQLLPGTGPLVAVTVLPRHWTSLHTLNHPGVTWALGLHPAEPHSSRDLAALIAALPTARAIGEVGLDGTPAGPVPLERQREELDVILSHRAARDRMVSIHSRRAAKPVIEHLERAALPGAVLHWFTGTPRQVEAAAATGAWFSVNERMGRRPDVVRAMPHGQVLLETDAPHGTVRGRSAGDVSGALSVLARAWDLPTGEVAAQVYANQQALARTLVLDPFRIG